MFPNGLTITVVTQGKTESAYNETKFYAQNSQRKILPAGTPGLTNPASAYTHPTQNWLWASLIHIALNCSF